MKQTEPNPWRLIADKYHEGQVITGRVRNLTDFGAFVEIEDGIDGLIHISDMSWTKRVEHPSEVLQKGQEVEVAVLNVDVERQRLSLGLKQLRPNVWDEYCLSNKANDVVDGTVTKLTNFGAFVELAEGIEGLIHVSEIADHHIKDPAEVLEVGEQLRVKILKVDPENRKIALSLKEGSGEREREREMPAPRPDEPRTKYQTDGTISLGDVIGKIDFGAAMDTADDKTDDEDEIERYDG